MPPIDPQAAARQVAEVFGRIHRERMAGLPLVNEALEVAVHGFCLHQGRVTGMLVTPWMMSLLLLPGAEDAWEALALGSKETHHFPAGPYRFTVNTIDGLGVCQMHSVHSPMRGFHSQAAALDAAALFMGLLMTPAAADVAPDPVDEELLGRILRGEPVPELDPQAVDAAESGASNNHRPRAPE